MFQSITGAFCGEIEAIPILFCTIESRGGGEGVKGKAPPINYVGPKRRTERRKARNSIDRTTNCENGENNRDSL